MEILLVLSVILIDIYRKTEDDGICGGGTCCAHEKCEQNIYRIHKQTETKKDAIKTKFDAVNAQHGIM